MRLLYWEVPEGPNNFGDALNGWLWPRELGAAADDGTGPWLFGIGSLLGDVRPVPDGEPKVVAGAGAGYGDPPVLDSTWSVYAVRGPRTADALGLPRSTPACDPAVLTRRHFPYAGVARQARVALMLHWRSANAAWQGMAGELGWACIDPRSEVEQVMRGIAGAELLLTEALHGAIVADAFRVPWLPIRTSPEVLEFKWLDWCESVGLEYRPTALPPLYEPPSRPGMLKRARVGIKRALVERGLRRAARLRPCLSSPEALGHAESRLAAALDQLRGDIVRGVYPGWREPTRAAGGSRRGAGD